MGIFDFRKSQVEPDDIKINEFWKWFLDFRGTINKMFINRDNDLMERTLNDVQDQLNKICLAAKQTMEFEFGRLPGGKWDLVLYHSGNPYLKSNAERMLALMPAEIKETWKVTILK